MTMTWEEQQTLLVKVERRFIPLLRREIQSMYREGLELYRAGRQDELNNKFFDPELLALIQEMYIKAGVPMARYIYKSMPTVRELTKKAGQMGISQQWLQDVKNYLGRYGLEFVTDIIGTIRGDMLDMFQLASANGWSYEKLANELLTTGLALRRARVIARTEVHRGAMVGSMQGARSLRYEVQKQWLSGKDARVRRNPKSKFDHSELNGQVVEMDQPFMNEEPIMFPGDPNASPSNTIQCRCVLNYIPKRDARGILILKK